MPGRITVPSRFPQPSESTEAILGSGHTNTGRGDRSGPGARPWSAQPCSTLIAPESVGGNAFPTDCSKTKRRPACPLSPFLASFFENHSASVTPPGYTRDHCKRTQHAPLLGTSVRVSEQLFLNREPPAERSRGCKRRNGRGALGVPFSRRQPPLRQCRNKTPSDHAPLIGVWPFGGAGGGGSKETHCGKPTPHVVLNNEPDVTFLCTRDTRPVERHAMYDHRMGSDGPRVDAMSEHTLLSWISEKNR